MYECQAIRAMDALGRENTDGFQGDTEEQIQRHIDVMSHYMRRIEMPVSSAAGAEGLISMGGHIPG